MLVGLVAKNGILLVEYAERSLRSGDDAVAAIQAAAALRFRPILMTTFAMIAGMLPLALGQTIGAEYRRALGTVVIGGLSSSLLLTLFVVPVVYIAYRSRARFKTERGGDLQRVSHRRDPLPSLAQSLGSANLARFRST
jgi:HAE1 family hydrophobic/amphiphilic exporter-1